MGIIRLKNTRWGLGAGDWAQGGYINFETAFLCKGRGGFKSEGRGGFSQLPEMSAEKIILGFRK